MRFPTSWDRVSVLQCLTLSCQNVALFHQRKKNSSATFPCNAYTKSYRQLYLQIHYHLLYSLTL